MDQLDPDALAALGSLQGRSGVPAVGQNQTDLPLDVLSVDGGTLKGLVPRLRLVGVEQVTIRFAAGSQPWRALFDLQEAEFHSNEQAS
jgi:hypothetical protein